MTHQLILGFQSGDRLAIDMRGATCVTENAGRITTMTLTWRDGRKTSYQFDSDEVVFTIREEDGDDV